MNKFNSLHVKTRLLIVFATVLAIASLLNFMSYRTTQGNLENNKWVQHTYKVIATANQALAELVNMETGMRGYLVAGKNEFLDPYKAGQIAYQARLIELQNLTADNPRQVGRWKDIGQRAQSWRADFAEKGLALRQQVNDGNAKFDELGIFVQQGGGKALFDEMRAVFSEAIAEEQALLTAREVKNTASSHRLLSTILWGSLGVVTLGFTLATLFARALVKPLTRITDALQQGANESASAAAQVSNASQSLADGSSQQAASIEETSASLEEMSSMTKRNAESAIQAKELSNQTRSAADAGAGRMDEMRRAMDEINTSSNDIGKIIKTIDEIAFQTNILALNAAVEAARAGEAGMGFAVVAEEVRALAQRSATAAKETATKIEAAIQKSEHGARISSSVASSLGEIVDKARKVDALVAEITTASQEQSQGIGQVNTAVSQMDKVTQSNAGNAEETAAAAEELNAQSQALKDAVAELRQLVNGTRTPNAAEQVKQAAPSSKARPVGKKAPEFSDTVA